MREIKALVIQALQLSPAAKPCVGGQQELDKIGGQAERARWWPSVGCEAGLLAGTVLPSGQSEPVPQRQPDGHIPCAQAQRRLPMALLPLPPQAAWLGGGSGGRDTMGAKGAR